LVDDGLATGATAIAATRQLRKRGASHIVFAAPVCSCYGAEALLRETDAVVCLQRPRNMVAVGYWYADFSPTTDKEALALLHDTEYRRVS
jgi:predicted phosphoribosyltransferase